jgi:hypothetical protein
VIVIDLQAEGGQAPPSVLTKYTDVMVGVTVIDVVLLEIRVPPQADEPVYHVKVPACWPVPE